VDVTGLPLSTYFSAIKLKWMVLHHRDVREAYEQDRMAFGTVDSWLLYVSRDISHFRSVLIPRRISLAQQTAEFT
jgi:glycerol kinase